MDTAHKVIRIAIIEDNSYVREGWIATLEKITDFSIVGSYESCEEAFESNGLDDADVALVDIGLPGMSGIQGVEHISRRNSSVAVLICTVYEEEQKIFDALCAGAVGYLLKKTQPEDLIKAINDAAAWDPLESTCRHASLSIL